MTWTQNAEIMGLCVGEKNLKVLSDVSAAHTVQWKTSHGIEFNKLDRSESAHSEIIKII